jgi:polynucleotide 5'-kinase involved in rRNA processing
MFNLKLKKDKKKNQEKEPIKVAILGGSGVGKRYFS